MMRFSFVNTQPLRTIGLSLLLYSALAGMQTQAGDSVDFSLPGLNGQTVTLSDYRGKWVVVNFWATWCPPCLEEIPELVIFHETHQDDIAVVIGINYEKVSDQTVKKFVDTYSISYPVAKANPEQKTVFGHVSGLPTSFLVNPAGEVVARQVGQVTSEIIETFIAANSEPGK